MISVYYLSINSVAMSRISEQQVYKFTRSENRQNSFAGTVCVDRSALKYRVISKAALMTQSEMNTLETAAAAITATVGFYDGTTLKSKTCVIKLPEKPVPIYKFQDKSKGVYYKDVRIEVEEV